MKIPGKIFLKIAIKISPNLKKKLMNTPSKENSCEIAMLHLLF
jgi:hypothetical protein